MQDAALVKTFISPIIPQMTLYSRLCATEIRESPTKPSGKGSKRKQDQLDEEDYVEEDDDDDEAEEEKDPKSWVEVLSQEMNSEDDEEADPDYEVG